MVMVTTVNNIILHMWKLLRDDILKVLITRKTFCNYICWWMLTRFMVIILQIYKYWIIVLYTWNWRRKWQPTPIFLPGKSYRQRSLADYSLWGWKESDTTEQLTHIIETNMYQLYLDEKVFQMDYRSKSKQ